MPHHICDSYCSSHERSQSWMLQNIFDYNSFGAALAQLLPAIYSDCCHIFKQCFFFSFQAIMQLIKGNSPLVTSVQPWRLLVIVSLSVFLHKSAVKGCPLSPESFCSRLVVGLQTCCFFHLWIKNKESKTRHGPDIWLRNTCYSLLCCAFRAHILCFSGEDARKQIPSYALFNIESWVNSKVEPGDICAAESLQMPREAQGTAQVRLRKKCVGDISLNVFSFCLVSHGGVVDRCPVSGSSAVPRTWAGRSAGSHTGTLGDQLNSRHSSHSPFEGKANREGFNGPPLTPPHRLRKGNTVLVSGLITR